MGARRTVREGGSDGDFGTRAARDMVPVVPPSDPGGNLRVIGRYALHDEIASGGMAKVHLGRMQGQVGFAKTVAIKRLHDHFAMDPEFREMFVDEAHIVARIQHPNVVAVLDVVALEGELFLVMEYVHGVPLSRLLRRLQKAGKRVDPRIAISIATGMLYGLHAAHEARRESGEPLNIVHRDVNPQNVMVGADGVARVLDFGIAKASHQYHQTGTGVVKGKLKYMAPEQIAGKTIDRRTDVFAASVVIWEMLTGEELFTATDPQQMLDDIVKGNYRAPSAVSPGISPELDAVVLKGLAAYPKQRHQTAHEMAVELEKTLPPATAREVGEWVESIAGDSIAAFDRKRAAVEGAASPLDRAPQRITGAEISGDIALGSVSGAAVAAPISSPDGANAPAVPPGLSTRTKVLILGATLLGALLLGFGVAATFGTRPPAVASPSLPSAAPVENAPTAASSSATPASTAVPAESALPTASAPASAPAASSAPAKPKLVPYPAKPANCKPPYTIGADGVKRYKPECF